MGKLPRLGLALVAVAAAIAYPGAAPPPPDLRSRPPESPPAVERRGQSDLDAFMEQVLARRDDNWKRVRQYILDEHVRIAVTGPAGTPLWGEERKYTWFMRDGVFVQSPVSVNGVSVPDDFRRAMEDAFARKALEREQEAREDAEAEGETVEAPVSAGAILSGASRPDFIDSAYFLEFEFEPGRYALVGREDFEGHEVLRIEHYPERLFTHEQDEEDERRANDEHDAEEDAEAVHERMFNKVSLVTLWVLPDEFQIVRYTFDNVDMDFLPAAWLVRITELRASMTMSEVFPDVWLPRSIDMDAGMQFAMGPVRAAYQVDYTDYREAETSGRILSVGP